MIRLTASRSAARIITKILTQFVGWRYTPPVKIMTHTSRIAIAVLWLCAVAAPQAQEPPKTAPKTAPATHVTKDEIQEFIAKLPRRIVGQPDPRG